MVSARFRITLVESQRVMVLASPEDLGVLLSRDLYMIRLKCLVVESSRTVCVLEQ